MTPLDIQNQLQSVDNSDLPIFTKWVDFLKWLLLTTEKFPKKVRFTFSDRLNNLALDIVEDLIEARFSKSKVGILKRANIKLEKIRILLRICFEQKLMAIQSYKFAMLSINEIGKMMGGWLKHQNVRK